MVFCKNILKDIIAVSPFPPPHTYTPLENEWDNSIRVLHVHLTRTTLDAGETLWLTKAIDTHSEQWDLKKQGRVSGFQNPFSTVLAVWSHTIYSSSKTTFSWQCWILPEPNGPRKQWKLRNPFCVPEKYFAGRNHIFPVSWKKPTGARPDTDPPNSHSLPY
jgi:hypothetical protein